jgi:S1-C subfamily serine protease
MVFALRLSVILLLLLLLTSGSASAQKAKGWLGADVVDITKAEADELGWDTPHGAKVRIVATGSPADKASLTAGDFSVVVERMMLDTSSDVEAAIAAKAPGTVIRRARSRSPAPPLHCRCALGASIQRGGDTP